MPAGRISARHWRRSSPRDERSSSHRSNEVATSRRHHTLDVGRSLVHFGPLLIARLLCCVLPCGVAEAAEHRRVSHSRGDTSDVFVQVSGGTAAVPLVPEWYRAGTGSLHREAGREQNQAVEQILARKRARYSRRGKRYRVILRTLGCSLVSALVCCLTSSSVPLSRGPSSSRGPSTSFDVPLFGPQSDVAPGPFHGDIGRCPLQIPL